MRRRYTKEFKEEAAKLIIEQGYSRTEAAKSLGVDRRNVSRWVEEIRGGSFCKKPVATAEQEELRRLRKENHQLRLEQEILKKAAAFFAKDHI